MSLSPLLVQAFSHVISSTTPPKEMLQAVITIIPKPGKSPDNVMNYRPISLLNCDIKIFLKLIADRVNSVLPSLIHPDQVGFISQRQASEGTRRILNLIQLAKLSPSDSILLSLDAEVFDRVNWHYLSLALEKFGFCDSIFHAIMSLYTSPSIVLASWVPLLPF